MKTAQANLSSPHFEYNLSALYTFLDVNNQKVQISKVSIDNFKAHLHHHLNKCKGPCFLNEYGYPTCLLSEKKTNIK